MKQYDEKIKQKHAAGEPQMLALLLLHRIKENLTTGLNEIKFLKFMGIRTRAEPTPPRAKTKLRPKERQIITTVRISIQIYPGVGIGDLLQCPGSRRIAARIMAWTRKTYLRVQHRKHQRTTNLHFGQGTRLEDFLTRLIVHLGRLCR
jgi:hypothetical protein